MIRPKNDRLLAGVCAALAQEFGIGSVAVRLLFVLLFWFFGLTLLIYLILWIVVPAES